MSNHNVMYRPIYVQRTNEVIRMELLSEYSHHRNQLDFERLYKHHAIILSPNLIVEYVNEYHYCVF